MSRDGAMVHLIGGEWVDVKTLAIGAVTRNRRGEVCTQQLSSCSHLGDAARFEHATLLATHRRGLKRATEVCAVYDGAGLAARAGRLPRCGCNAHPLWYACRRTDQRDEAGGAVSRRPLACWLARGHGPPVSA